MSHKLRAHLMLTAVVCVWGATFVVIKSALADISPLLFNLIRMTIASACLLAIYGRRLRRLRWATLGAGALTGLCLAAGYQFQTAGLRLTTPSKSAFLTGLVVVLVPLLAGIPGLRPPGASLPKWNAWLGVVAAFVGIVLLTAPQGSGWSILMLREINPGDLLTLACALGFSLHVIALAHFSPRFDFEQLAILQIVFCTLAMGVTTPLLEKCWVHWTPRVVIALVVAAVLATAAALYRAGLGAANFASDTHGADSCAGAGFCLGDRLSGAENRAARKGDCGCVADSGRDWRHGIDAVAHATHDAGNAFHLIRTL